MRKYNKTEVEFIQERACERVTEVLDAMGVEYTERRSYLQGPCPVHKGDNHRAWYWAFNSRHWKCSTQHCETQAVSGGSNSIFGLIRGAMAVKTDKPWSFQQSVHFAAQVLGLADTQMDPKTEAELEVDRAIRNHRKRLSQQPAKSGLHLSSVLPRLQPDTVYYPKRGVSADLIAKYHISLCDNPKQPFYQRAFFPILDETGRYVLGWSARSTFEKCSECKTHHAPDQCSPDNKHDARFAKWRHSTDFHAERCLYNIWHARPFISQTGVAIINEGPGDVWAYEAAGIKNSVAMLGLNLSPVQRAMLQKAGALTLVFTTDNDKAGKEAQGRLYEELQWYFRIFFLTPAGHKDIGDTPPPEIQAQVLPVLQNLSREGILRDFSEGGEQ